MFEEIVLISAGTLTALHAGLLYDFSVDIVRSLRALPAKEHIRMMQTINKKIENGVFFLSFFGPVFLLPYAAWLYRGEQPFGFLLAASLICIVACQGVTMMANIPLNRKLASVDTRAISDKEAETVRKNFQGPFAPWMVWHTVRTLAGITATVLTFIAALKA